MALSPEAQAIKAALDKYLEGKDFSYHPDPQVVERVLEGLAKRQAKLGKLFCPCRIVTGKPDADEKIVCPCAMHAEELARQGYCHCRLFVSAAFAAENKGA